MHAQLLRPPTGMAAFIVIWSGQVFSLLGTAMTKKFVGRAAHLRHQQLFQQHRHGVDCADGAGPYRCE